jgi:hypothetical protein
MLWYLSVPLIVSVLLATSLPSSYFDSRLSQTFEFTEQEFFLSYLDGTELVGNVCRDQISLGKFQCVGSFGCISPRHKSFMFSGETSGILGLGFPVEDSDMKSTNLFWSITNINSTSARNAKDEYPIPPKVFTLVLDKNGGSELQIGGYDLSRIDNVYVENAFDAPISTECEDPLTMDDCKFRHFRMSIDTVRLGILSFFL